MTFAPRHLHRDSCTDVVLPIVNKAPFLYRNHRGYNILSSGGGINDVKDAVSLEHKKLRVSARNFAKKKLSVKRAPEESSLEDAVVRMKKEHLFNLFSKGCDSRAADLIVFEFFNMRVLLVRFLITKNPMTNLFFSFKRSGCQNLCQWSTIFRWY